MNKGYTGVEIADMIKLPPELDKHWYNRGYYGSLQHNTRAVYQRYMGFYDANPSTLDHLPPEAAAKKYVEYMGGAAAILTEGQGGLRQGRIPLGRRSAQARRLRRPEQQGRQGAARGYLRAAGLSGRSPARGARSICRARSSCATACPTAGGINTASPDTIKAMPPEMLFDYFAVRLNGPKAAGKKITLNIDFTDLNKPYGLMVENGVLNYARKPVAKRRCQAHADQGHAGPHPAQGNHARAGDRHRAT